MGVLAFSAPRILRQDDDVNDFSCGVPRINTWIAERLRGARDAGTAVVYGSFCDGKLAGFYALSSQSVARTDASGWLTRNTPAQIPVILLGMLGVDKRYQGEGLGRDLLLDAVHRAGYVSEQVGAKALIVDPIDDDAEAFYSRYGFRPIPEAARIYAKL